MHRRSSECGELGPDGRCRRCGGRIWPRLWLAVAAAIALGAALAWGLVKLSYGS